MGKLTEKIYLPLFWCIFWFMNALDVTPLTVRFNYILFFIMASNQQNVVKKLLVNYLEFQTFHIS